MRTPSYLVKYHNGIYSFRYVIPISDAHLFPNNHREIRRSLKTRVRYQALKLARVYWVKMTERKISTLEDPISDWQVKMRRGSAILDELENFESSYEQTCSTDTYEEFITHLSDYDIDCLNLAIETATGKDIAGLIVTSIETKLKWKRDVTESL